jgi:hypothetical protein
MLIVGVAVIGSFLVSWSASTFATQRVNISNEVNNRVNQINENYIIEDVWFYGGNDMKVTIRNTGEVTMNVTQIYINNTKVWPMVPTTGQTVWTAAEESKNPAHKSYSQITVLDVSPVYGSGKPQTIWVHTAVGTDVRQTWKAP